MIVVIQVILNVFCLIHLCLWKHNGIVGIGFVL